MLMCWKIVPCGKAAPMKPQHSCLNLNSIMNPGMVHTHTRKAEAGRSEFRVSLVYRVNSTTSWATCQNPASKYQKEEKKEEEEEEEEKEREKKNCMMTQVNMTIWKVKFINN